MPFELHAAIVDPGDGQIKVEHIFYGETEAECDDYFNEHLGTCSYFRGAESSGHVLTWTEEVEDLPTRETVEADLEDGG